MAHVHALKILEIRPETEESVSILFEIPEGLKRDFEFQPGQYLTLRSTIDGQDIRRNYSICSGLKEAGLRVGIKKVSAGLFSTYANDILKAGDCLDVLPPAGQFTSPIVPDHEKHYLMIAAGSGITPVLSLIKSILTVERGSKVTLIYGNKNTASIMFLEELCALKDQFSTRFTLFHILTRQARETPLLNGRLTRGKFNDLFKGAIDPEVMDEVFLCGPHAMISEAQAALSQAGIQQPQIHVELFASPDKEAAIHKAQKKRRQDMTAKELSSARTVTVIFDGIETTHHIATEGPPILDAIMKHRADIPFSCKGGMCCTCRCKVLEGRVEMDVNYALGPQEVADGFILACQGHPVSDQVILDFDNK